MSGIDATGGGTPWPWERLDGVDTDPAARGAVYTLLARTFDQPDEALYEALADGSLAEQVADLVDQTRLTVTPPSLTTDDDYETLCARFNDLFAIGFSEYLDRTDGTLSSTGPPVPLYESAYRPETSWNDVNLDLARAYDYFDVEIASENRENHDHVQLELEFMGYLARREAALDESVARARLDFHDRHLRVFATGLTERIGDEDGTDVYGDLVGFLDAFSAADVDDLAVRIEDGDGP
ncbi:molecular chaperone TorD family protein [Halobacteriaceae archaeon GCM10025711]